MPFSAGDRRLVIPDLPSLDASELAEDEQLISRLEICMSEWTSVMQSFLQQEAQRHVQGKGKSSSPLEHATSLMSAFRLTVRHAADSQSWAASTCTNRTAPHFPVRYFVCSQVHWQKWTSGRHGTRCWEGCMNPWTCRMPGRLC